MVSCNPISVCHCEPSLRRRPRSNLLITFLLFFLIGCAPASPAGTVASPPPTIPPESAFLTPAPPTEAPPIPGLSAEQIRNAQYQLGFTDALRIVQLANGTYQSGSISGPEYIEVRVSEFIALGDLNNDGVNEAAAVMFENYGGTGRFAFLALFNEINGIPVFKASVFIDDRPIIGGIGIEDGEIFLIATTHDSDDPFCCPTLQTERHFRLFDNQLKLTDYTTFTPQGNPRRITIESPANSAEVFSSIQIKGNVTVAPFENNLTYRILDLGGVELAVGAINVISTSPGGPGSFDSTILLGNILQDTIIRIEIQDLSAEDGSLFAMDSVELVVK